MRWYWENVYAGGIDPDDNAVQFSGNSPWDPDYTSLGASANMWSVFSNMYRKYTCLSSKIFWQFEVLQLGFQYEIYNLILPAEPGAPYPTQVDTMYAQPKDRMALKRLANIPGTTTRPMTIMKMSSTTKKVYGEVISSDINASTSDDPDREWVYNLASNIITTDGDFDRQWRVWITYWVTFEEPLLIPPI